MQKKFTHWSFPKISTRDKSSQNTEDRIHTYETFDIDPVTSGKAGGAATGSAGDENVMAFQNTTLEYHMLGTQTILAPVLTATGLNVALDQTSNDGVEISQGIFSNSRHAYTIGTDGPFFFRVKFKIGTVAGVDECAVGFRKAEAYQANIDDYDEAACLNVISGNITIESILNGGGTTVKDTTDNWADAETKTLQVNVSAAGVVSYKIDAADPTADATTPFSFDTSEVVVPYFHQLQTATTSGALEIIEWECGLGQ